MARQLLIDSFSFKLSQLHESENGDKYTLVGKFAQADIPTANGRVYGRHLWEREIARLNPLCVQGKVFGELDHPDDGKTKLQRSAVIIKRLWIDENGQIMGEMKVMNTSQGRELKAIIDDGGAVGVSSRGYGSVVREGSSLIVQDDFTLLTFDPVADPAENSAYPVVIKNAGTEATEIVKAGFQESIDRKKLNSAISDAKKIFVSRLKEMSRKEALENAINESFPKISGSYDKKDFTIDVAAEVMNIRESDEHRDSKENEMNTIQSQTGIAKVPSYEEVEKIVYESLAPIVAGKEAQVESLKAKLEKTRKALEESKAKEKQLESVAKELGYSLYIQQHLGSHPRLKQIREGLGDISLIESLDALKGLLSAHIAEVQSLKESRLEEQKGLQEKLDESKNLLAEANARISIVENERDEAVRIGNEHAAELYLEKRISKSPVQSEIRLAFKKMSYESKTIEGVQALLEHYKNIQISKASDYSAVRSRLKESQIRMESQKVVESHIEETKPGNNAKDFFLEEIGQSYQELKRLAGV